MKENWRDGLVRNDFQSNRRHLTVISSIILRVLLSAQHFFAIRTGYLNFSGHLTTKISPFIHYLKNHFRAYRNIYKINSKEKVI